MAEAARPPQTTTPHPHPQARRAPGGWSGQGARPPRLRHMLARRARPLRATAPLLMAMPAVCAEVEEEEEEEEEERCRAR